MVEKEVTVVNENGFHTRPGKNFVDKAKTYPCEIMISKGDKVANAKSLFKVMKIGISKGDTVKLTFEGDNEEAAAESLVEFINDLEG